MAEGIRLLLVIDEEKLRSNNPDVVSTLQVGGAIFELTKSKLLQMFFGDEVREKRPRGRPPKTDSPSRQLPLIPRQASKSRPVREGVRDLSDVRQAIIDVLKEHQPLTTKELRGYLPPQMATLMGGALGVLMAQMRLSGLITNDGPMTAWRLGSTRLGPARPAGKRSPNAVVTPRMQLKERVLAALSKKPMSTLELDTLFGTRGRPDSLMAKLMYELGKERRAKRDTKGGPWRLVEAAPKRMSKGGHK